MASSSSGAANNPPDPSKDQSYTMIGDADLEAIGAHCHYNYCHQLDFLPFRCESCKHTYCLDHRTESSHACPNAGAWASAKRKAATAGSKGSTTLSEKPTPGTGQQCSHPVCKTFVNTGTSVGVHCANCNRDYCLKHRLREDHDCSRLTPLGARPAGQGSTQAQRAAAALGKFRLWGREKANAAVQSAKPKPSSAAQRMVALTALKKSAKGDAKIAADKRVYLYVEAEKESTTSKLSKGEFFYSAEWSVGRMLDEAAKNLQVQNLNNRGTDEETRLRVFHVEGGRLLEFGEKVGSALQSGNTIVLLRGVGPAIPNLVEP